MLKTLSAALTVLVLLSAGLYASLVPPPPQYIVPASHKAHVVAFMPVGALGYVGRYDFAMAYDGRLWVDRDARYDTQMSASYSVRVLRVADGLCVDERTLPRDMVPSVASRYMRSERVVDCDQLNFVRRWR